MTSEAVVCAGQQALASDDAQPLPILTYEVQGCKVIMEAGSTMSVTHCWLQACHSSCMNCAEMLHCTHDSAWQCLQDTVDQHLRDARLPPVMQAHLGGSHAMRIVSKGLPYRSEKEDDFCQVRCILHAALCMSCAPAVPLNSSDGTGASRMPAWVISMCTHTCPAGGSSWHMNWCGMQVSLEVRGKRTLEDSLDFYVQGELMEGENQWFCEEAGQKVRACTPICCARVCSRACCSRLCSCMGHWCEQSTQKMLWHSAAWSCCQASVSRMWLLCMLGCT